MISRLDPRYKSHRFKSILRNARERNGIESQGELLERSGIKPSTFYDHLREGDFTWKELRMLFKVANFTNEEILEVMR